MFDGGGVFTPLATSELFDGLQFVLVYCIGSLCESRQTDERSFRNALRPALPTAGLIAYPVARGVLEARVSHVFIFSL